MGKLRIVASVLALVWACGCANHRDPRVDSTAAGAYTPARSIADPGFLEQFAATNRFRLGQPTAIKPVPGGKHILFLRSPPRSFVQDLYEHDIETGRERVLLTAEQILAGNEEVLTAEELARRERMRLSSRGIAGYELSKDGSKILVPLSGRLFVIDRATGAKRELISSSGFPIDPRFSPDASRVACVRNGEVHVIDVATGAEQQVTTGAGGPGNTIEHGLAEFVAQEEMDRREGYWWSPDASMIAYQRTDTAGMETFHIADPVNPDKDPQSWPYPRAGKKNADVSLHIAPANNTGAMPVRVNWDSSRYPYLARVSWPEKGPMTILIQNREQTEQQLLEVDPATGSTRTIMTERDSAWINLHHEPKWVEDGTKFLWLSDAGGSTALELRERGGSLIRRLTPDTMEVREILAVDDERGVAYVAASGPGPKYEEASLLKPDEMISRTRRESHIDAPTHIGPWRISWRAPDSDPSPLTIPKQSTAIFAADFSSSIIVTPPDIDMFTIQQKSTAPLYSIRVRDNASGSLRSVSEEPSFPLTVDLEFHESPSGRAYRSAIFRPRNFEPGRKYPIILSVYGGPGLQYVTAAPRGWQLDQWYADHGFIVVRIDGRGTPGRGRDWERAIKNNLIDIPLDDQVEALEALAYKHPEMDLERVGVYGWSFGGYFSAMAAMRRPDIFKAGIAGAPVCDWADYDTHYTERYMGLPEANAGGYRDSNVLTYCKDLKVPLLVIHGTADDNVYFMHSLKMTDALFRAGKHYEFLALPGFTHMVPDPVVTKALYSRVAEFFIRHLKP